MCCATITTTTAEDTARCVPAPLPLPRHVPPLRVAKDPHDALASRCGRVEIGASKRNSVTSGGSSSIGVTRDSSDAGIAASSTAGTMRPRRLVQNRLVANIVDHHRRHRTSVRRLIGGRQ